MKWKTGGMFSLAALVGLSFIAADLVVASVTSPAFASGCRCQGGRPRTAYRPPAQTARPPTQTTRQPFNPPPRYVPYIPRNLPMGFGRLSDRQINEALTAHMVKFPDTPWLDAKIAFYKGGYVILRTLDVGTAVAGLPAAYLGAPIGIVYHPVKWVSRTIVHGPSRTWTALKEEYGWVPRYVNKFLEGSSNDLPTPPPVPQPKAPPRASAVKANQAAPPATPPPNAPPPTAPPQ